MVRASLLFIVLDKEMVPRIHSGLFIIEMKASYNITKLKFAHMLRVFLYNCITNVKSLFQACRTTLSIAQIMEQQGANYSELERIYNKACKLATAANNKKLEASALRSLYETQKFKGREHLAGNLIGN